MRDTHTPPVEAYMKCPAVKNEPIGTKLQLSRLCPAVSSGIKVVVNFN